MKNISFKNYLSTIALIAVLLLGLIICFNAVIDPFEMNLAFKITGINTYKPEVFERVRLLKSYEIRRIKPDSIILGSSRSHIGFNPNNKTWAKYAQNRYNLAFDGATTKEMYFYLLHAQAVHPLKLVILSLDTYHPNGNASTSSDFDEDLLMKNNGLFARIKLFLIDLKILTSFDTFKSSLSTIRSQRDAHTSWLSLNGERDGELFFRRKGGDLSKYTPRVYFDKKERLDIQENIELEQSKMNKKAYHENSPLLQDPLSSLDYIRQIIDFCRTNNIDLKILFTPSHVHEWDIDDWHSKIEGKRKMVKILSEDAARHPTKAPIPLFDFSTFSSITTEAVPPLGSKNELKFYWDYSHFKDQVGDLVLNRIFNADDPQNPPPANFGILLTANNIENVITKLKADHLLYQQQHPQDIQRINSWKKELQNSKLLP